MALKPMLLGLAMASAASILPAGAAQLTVGFSQIGSESGWRAAETTVSKSEAAKRSVNLKIADAQQKQENQIKASRSFIAQGVDVDLSSPVVLKRLGTGAKEIKKANIPVICSSRPSSDAASPSIDVHRLGLRAGRPAGRRRVAGQEDGRTTRKSPSCRARSASAPRPSTARRVSTTAIAKYSA